MPGITPSLISGCPNLALSAAMMRSHCIANLAAAAEREARHRRDYRLAHARDTILVAGEVAEVDVGVGFARHLLDVGPGGKCLLRSGDTTQPTFWSLSNASSATFNSSTSAALSALSACDG